MASINNVGMRWTSKTSGIGVEEVGGLPSWTAMGAMAFEGSFRMQGRVVVKPHALDVLSTSFENIHCRFYILAPRTTVTGTIYKGDIDFCMSYNMTRQSL